MPRTVQISVPPERTAEVLAEMQRLGGLLGLRLQRGASLEPEGDVISAEVTSAALHDLMRVLDRLAWPQARAAP